MSNHPGKNESNKTAKGLNIHVKLCRKKSEVQADEAAEKSPEAENEHPDSIFKDVYDVIVKWRRNIFDLPKGAAGKQFVSMMTRYVNACCEKVREHSLYALSIMPIILLQRTSNK